MLPHILRLSTSMKKKLRLKSLENLEDQRSVYTKSFRLSNGTVSTVEYESDVHYKDEDDEWQPIDNSLIFEDSQGNTGAEAESGTIFIFG